MSESHSKTIAPPHFEDQAYRELVRSRRHQRPMSIIVVLTGPTHRRRLRLRANHPPAPVAAVQEMVRRYDVVDAWLGHVAVLCPELGEEGATGMTQRLSSLGRAGSATFPEDGSNLHSLIRLAIERAKGVQGPEVEPPLHLPEAADSGGSGTDLGSDPVVSQQDSADHPELTEREV